MIPARSILYALILIFFVASSSGLLLAFNYISNQQQTDQIQKERALNNLHSGLTLLKVGEGSPSGEWLMPYEELDEQLYLQQYDWGLLSIGIVKVTFPLLGGVDTLTKSCSLGQANPSGLLSALFLKDQVSPLAVAGNNQIIGDAHLPKLGIKSTVINGQGFIGNSMILGKKLKSSRTLPPFSMERLESIINLSKLEGKAEMKSQHLMRSFTDAPWAIKGDQLKISGVSLKGHIVIIGQSELIIAADAILDDVLLIAPKITIEEGFHGKIQAYATESLETGEYCEFKYPSVLGLLRNDRLTGNTKNSHLTIGAHSKLTGLAFIKEMKPMDYPATLHIAKGTTVTGQVWCEGQTEHKGTIIGNLTTESFILRVGSSLYKNHLMDAIIDRPALPRNYVHPIIHKNNQPMDIIDWLE